MDESTQTETEQNSPKDYGYCSWHNRFAENVRRIQLTEAGSGGLVHYACVHCVRIWKLTPAADQ
ncbi:hypothetical protein ACFQ9U_23095 [Streptomyces sp. NPDC056568]|uniref:hypothetical protein n=1 Tax=Streptomyces sp. NPDC056568 TaxID=3345866 RepID=UPI0036763D83